MYGTDFIFYAKDIQMRKSKGENNSLFRAACQNYIKLPISLVWQFCMLAWQWCNNTFAYKINAFFVLFTIQQEKVLGRESKLTKETKMMWL